jgi:hypothetical protein
MLNIIMVVVDCVLHCHEVREHDPQYIVLTEAIAQPLTHLHARSKLTLTATYKQQG